MIQEPKYKLSSFVYRFSNENAIGGRQQIFSTPAAKQKEITRKMKTIDSPEEVKDEQRRRPNTQLLLNYPVAFSFQPHVTNMLLTHFCPLIILIVAGSAVANCCFGSDGAWIDKIDVFRGRF